jgi:hypothetical protein
LLGSDEDGIPRWLEEEPDAVGPKPATDVVVRGSAHSPRPESAWEVAVAVGRSVRLLRAVGERRVTMKGGRARFTRPLATTRVSLDWRFAYGGYDAHAQEELRPPPSAIDFIHGREGVRKQGIFAYPRNRVGRGYFVDVDRARADGTALPQIEDAAELLLPERLFVPRPRAWIDAPLPGGLGWVLHSWYPRIARIVGDVLAFRPSRRPIRETTFADGGDLLTPRARGEISARVMQAAAPGLAVERLRGDELTILRGLSPTDEEIRFQLPGEQPRITLRPPGVRRLFEPEPVLQTVRVDTDAQTLSLTWCGPVRLAAPLSEGEIEDCRARVAW